MRAIAPLLDADAADSRRRVTLFGLGAGLRGYRVELLWAAFATANYLAMIAWPYWETIPFHFVWISITLLYGFRVWPTRMTLTILATVMALTTASIMLDAYRGIQEWGELFEVPLMAAMFLAMVWHARRRVEAFAFGTRLTRITHELNGRDPDRALDRATAAVSDMSGGTRIGDALSTLNRVHGRRLGRGAVVVILSDGWDRGDPELLGTEIARLGRSAHRPSRGSWRRATLGVGQTTSTGQSQPIPRR